MDIEQLYQDFSVDFRTEGHKHCRPGWVNTECPWCISDSGHEGYHLGYNLQNDFYTCWRCGNHPVVPTLIKLLRIDENKVRTALKGYGLYAPKSVKNSDNLIRTKAHKLPSNTVPLQTNHKRYLQGRGFDPEYLEAEWGLLGSGPISMLDGINYNHRIIIPFFWDGRQVSFDSRDITGKHPSKYMACPKEREYIPHKEILYGKQDKWKSVGICVEGPTDVWRFGPSSFATSGIKFTTKQMRTIARNFKRVAVCFDGGESQALMQAKILVSDLRMLGCDAFRVDIEGDPGDMKQSEANYFVKQLIK